MTKQKNPLVWVEVFFRIPESVSPAEKLLIPGHKFIRSDVLAQLKEERMKMAKKAKKKMNGSDKK